MKKTILLLALILSVLVPSPAGAYSAFGDACRVNGNKSTACSANGSDTINGPRGIIKKVSLIIASIAGVAAVIVMMVGGLQYVISNGDPQKTANARSALIGGAVGIGIVLVAQSIVLLVLSRL